MKKTANPLIVLASVGLCLGPAFLRGASYSEAEFTRLENDVKILKENAAPTQAAVGTQVKAVSSISTGPNSRAELKFPDNSLTRLGSNSRFTIRGEARTLDLNEGAMFLEVPKKIGGAKVRTAAVTAAVTGTTVILEFIPGSNGKPGILKVIVIEGSMDLFNNQKPSIFRTVNAGQMIIMDPNSKFFPQAVDVDLKRLLKTSKLWHFRDHDHDHPNFDHVMKSVQNQQNQLGNGQLVETNLVILGRGTLVDLISGLRDNLLNPFFAPPVVPPAAPGGGGPGGTKNFFTPPPTTTTTTTVQPIAAELAAIPGTTVLNSRSRINTDPTVYAWNSAAQGYLCSDGKIYHPAVNGRFSIYAFGSQAGNAPPNVFVFGFLPPGLPSNFVSQAKSWAAFRFQQLIINGNPSITSHLTPFVRFNIGDSQAVKNLILAADNGITIGRDCSLVVPCDPRTRGAKPTGNILNLACDTSLNNLLLYTNTGDIDLQSRFTVKAGQNFGDGCTLNQNVAFIAASTQSNVNINGNVKLAGGSTFTGVAGNNLTVSGTLNLADTSAFALGAGNDVDISGKHASVSTAEGLINSNHDINITGAPLTASDSLQINAKNNINITAGADLESTGTDGSGLGAIDLYTQQGIINIADSTVNAAGDVNMVALASDISVSNSTITGANVTMTAGRDVTISNGSTVTAQPAAVVAGVAQHPAGTVGGSGDSTNPAAIHITATRNINVTNSSVLKVLSDSPSALLSLVAQKGNITIDTATLQVGTNTGAGTTLSLQTNQGNIGINQSTLSADIIKALALGPNGQITIGNSTFNATTLLKLYATGSNGMINFVAPTTLNSPTVNIAASTVQITGASTVVTVKSGANFNVYTNHPNFNTTGFGQFSNGTSPVGSPSQSFSSRPTY